MPPHPDTPAKPYLNKHTVDCHIGSFDTFVTFIL